MNLKILKINNFSTMKIKLFTVLIWVATAFFFASCNGKVFYEKIDHIDNEVWNVDSLLHYEIEITDSLQFYNIYINIRNTVDFETQYFYLFLTSEFPNGYIGQDTLGCILCDPYGKWTGKGAGRIKENRFLFKPKVRFDQKGIYKFTVRQAMRNDNVKGISDFGISLYNFEKDNIKVK